MGRKESQLGGQEWMACSLLCPVVGCGGSNFWNSDVKVISLFDDSGVWVR